jgi:hypothetical protein
MELLESWIDPELAQELSLSSEAGVGLEAARQLEDGG